MPITIHISSTNRLRRRWGRPSSLSGTPPTVGGAYPGIAPKYALPAGMTYNPATDLVDGTVWDEHHFRFPVQGGREVRPQNGAELTAAASSIQLGDNVILRTDVSYDNVKMVFPNFGTIPTPGQSRWWIGSEAIYNGAFAVPASRLTPWAGVTPTTPGMARVNLNGPTTTSPGPRAGVVFRDSSSAGHGTFAGIFFGPDYGPQTIADPVANMFSIGLGGPPVVSTAMMPHYICIDRCLFDGGADASLPGDDPAFVWVNFIACNGKWISLTGSWLQNLMRYPGEGKGFTGTAGGGRVKLNGTVFLDCGVAAWFYGGGASGALDDPFANFEIQFTVVGYTAVRRAKSRILLADIDEPGAYRWCMKNLGELKQGEHGLIQACLGFRSWSGGQAGQGLTIKATDQTADSAGNDYDMGFTSTKNIHVRYNAMDRVTSGIIFSGRPDPWPAVGRSIVPAHRLSATDLLVTNINHEDEESGVNLGSAVQVRGEDHQEGAKIGPGAMHSVQLARVTGVPRNHSAMHQPVASTIDMLQPMEHAEMDRMILEYKNNWTATIPSINSVTGLDGIQSFNRTMAEATRLIKDNCWVNPKNGVTYPTDNGNRVVANRAAVGYRDDAAGDYMIAEGHENYGRGCNVDRLEELLAPVRAKLVGYL